MNGIPLLFKLFLNGKHVGYEKHEYIMGFTEILHSLDRETWYWITDGEESEYIPHDKKRQWTGYVDMHGNEIFLGDTLTDNVTGRQYGKVEMRDGTLAVFCYQAGVKHIYFHASDFRHYAVDKGMDGKKCVIAET